jgi:hypothetical protein
MEKFYRESAFIYSNNSYCRARGYEEIDEAFVREELGLPQKAEHESQNDEHDGLVRFILESARRIFLTVLSLDKDVDDNLKYMEVVYRKQYTNVMLPFTPQMQAELGLKPRSQLNFDKNQWQHLAPTFSTDSFLMRLDLRQPLPFTKMEKKQGKDGATCEVYRVEVDPDHMDVSRFATLSNCEYGVKLTCI